MSGLATTDSWVPFQCWTRPPFWDQPTAQPSVAAVRSIRNSPLRAVTAGAGTTDQLAANAGLAANRSATATPAQVPAYTERSLMVPPPDNRAGAWRPPPPGRGLVRIYAGVPAGATTGGGDCAAVADSGATVTSRGRCRPGGG